MYGWTRQQTAVPISPAKYKEISGATFNDATDSPYCFSGYIIQCISSYSNLVRGKKITAGALLLKVRFQLASEGI